MVVRLHGIDRVACKYVANDLGGSGCYVGTIVLYRVHVGGDVGTIVLYRVQVG